MDLDEAARVFREFVTVIKALRTPGTGCPWDLEQTHATLRPYLIEEAYEVLAAIDLGDDGALRDELGDLLLQVVLHAQLADDRGAFSIADVVCGITAKMVRRHPHVFGSVRVSGADEVRRIWEEIKAAEAGGPGAAPSRGDALAGVPEGLPALLRAQRLAEKAGRAHSDGAPVGDTFAKVREALARLEGHAAAGDEGRARLEHELGDLLFGVCQLARRLGLSAEDSLRGSSRRFVEDFRRLVQGAPRPPGEEPAAGREAGAPCDTDTPGPG
jgi:MazG family protein